VHANFGGLGGCGTATATVPPGYPAIYFQFCVTDEQCQWPNISWCQRESDRSHSSDLTISDKVRARYPALAQQLFGDSQTLGDTRSIISVTRVNFSRGLPAFIPPARSAASILSHSCNPI